MLKPLCSIRKFAWFEKFLNLIMRERISIISKLLEHRVCGIYVCELYTNFRLVQIVCDDISG